MLHCDKSYGVRRGLILLCLCALAIPSVRLLPCQDEAAIKKEFKLPAKTYRPMVRWWWPGDDVTDEEIIREIGVLDGAGFGGAEVQTLVTFFQAGVSKEEQTRINSFAQPSYFQHVRTAAEAARSHGMWIDNTFGTGWPFGGGMAITPELASIELCFADTFVSGPSAFFGKLAIPQWKPDFLTSAMTQLGGKPYWPAGWEERFAARSKIIAVVAMRSVASTVGDADRNKPGKPELLEQSSAVVLTDKMQPDGTLNWQVPEGNWHIFVFRQIPTRQLVVGASGTGPQLVLDHFDEAAFAAHAKRVGDPLVAVAAPYIGNSLRAIFCDSLELEQFLAWSDDFLDQFKKRRGYDLVPYLPILSQRGYNQSNDSFTGGLPLYDFAGGDAIRADYWKTVSELIFERFYHPLDEWAKEHKLLSRVQAHGAPGDILKIYGDASIPETEELGGNNTVNFMKLAASAGYDYGRPIVSSESFVFHGNPNTSTPESLKANTDKMLISGVNEIIYHGFPYKFGVGIKGIGWFPFRMVSTPVTETNTIWPFIPTVNAYITRLQFIAQQGRSDLQVAIFRSGLNTDDTGPAPASGPVADPFPAIEESLTSAGYSFGFVNEVTLLRSVAKNSLFTTKDGGRYSALLIPREACVTPELAKALKVFGAAKVPLLFVGGTPRENVSFKSMQQDLGRVDSYLQSAMHASSAIQAAGPDKAAVALAKVIRPQLSFRSGVTLPFVKKIIGSTRFYLLTNPHNKQASATVDFTEHAAPELWDPFTGGVQKAAFARSGGHVEVVVSLAAYGSELLAFNNANWNAPPIPSVVWSELKSQKVGGSGWSIDAAGNSEKGAGIQLHVDMAKLTDWLDEPTLRTFSGSATYRTAISISARDLTAAKRIVLDLGTVKDAAKVSVNEVSAGILIVEPFAVDIKPLLHPGENEIEITVANSLTNYVSSLKGSAVSMYQSGHYPPVSSGLIGPVGLRYQISTANAQ
ncbi:MAG TPA: glycosyl hydrolase [Terracidiphilus sp.]|nr:glycosyl hydrolase [Terracidiphilus sp.]